MDWSPEARKRLRECSHQYDTPEVPTKALILALGDIIGPQVFGTDDLLGLVDVIREIILEPTIQSAKIATFMIGEDYETRDIQCACLCLRDGGPAFKCTKIKDEHRKAIDELLEAKP